VAPVSYEDTVTEFPDRCSTIEAQMEYQAGFSIGYEARFNEGRLEWESNSLDSGKDVGYDDGINERAYNCVVPSGYHLQAYQSGYATGYSNAEEELLQEEQTEADEEAIRISIRAGKDAGYDDGINGREYNCVAPDNEPNKASWEYGYNMRHNAGLAKYQNALTAANQNIPLDVNTTNTTVNNTEVNVNGTVNSTMNSSVNGTEENVNSTITISVQENESKSIIERIKNFLRGLFSF